MTAALASHGTLHLTAGWFVFIFGVLVGFVACFAIEHRK